MSSAASRWLAIVNPASGGGRAGRRWPALRSALAVANVEFDEVSTMSSGEGQAIARAAVLDGRRQLLIVGGDGSAHDVVNGVMNAAVPAGDPVTLAIAPGGTGDDWAHGLRMPHDPGLIARAIASGRSVPHDVGLLRRDASDADPASHRWFVNVAGVGFDAWVLSRMSPGVRTRATYLAGAVHGLVDYRAGDITLLSRGETQDGRLLAVFVAIGPYCGGGMHVAPGAVRDDGEFDVVAIRDAGFLGTLRRLPRLYTGAILRDPLVRHFRSDRLRVESDPPGGVQLDGQVTGATPVVFECRRAAFRVVPGDDFPGGRLTDQAALARSRG